MDEPQPEPVNDYWEENEAAKKLNAVFTKSNLRAAPWNVASAGEPWRIFGRGTAVSYRCRHDRCECLPVWRSFDADGGSYIASGNRCSRSTGRSIRWLRKRKPVNRSLVRSLQAPSSSRATWSASLRRCDQVRALACLQQPGRRWAALWHRLLASLRLPPRPYKPAVLAVGPQACQRKRLSERLPETRPNSPELGPQSHLWQLSVGGAK